MSETQDTSLEKTTASVGSSADLADLDTVTEAEKGAVMELRNKVGEIMRHADGRPFTITLLGKDSRTFVELSRAIQDRRVMQNMRTQQGIKAASLYNDEVELLAAVTKNMDMIFRGEPVKNNKEAYKEIYRSYPIIKEQADLFVGNRENFSVR